MTTKSYNNDCFGRDKCIIDRIIGMPSFNWLVRKGIIAVTVRAVTICVAIGFCMTAPALAEEQSNSDGIFVAKFAWTNKVNSERNFEEKYVDRGPNAPIMFWTKVHARQDALESLSKEGRLPIWHQWFVSCGDEYLVDQLEKPIDAIKLGNISSETIVPKLQSEIKKQGYFDWRTWSEKENVSSCWYRVKVVDNKNKILYCKEIEKSCELTIKIDE